MGCHSGYLVCGESGCFDYSIGLLVSEVDVGVTRVRTRK